MFLFSNDMLASFGEFFKFNKQPNEGVHEYSTRSLSNSCYQKHFLKEIKNLAFSKKAKNPFFSSTRKTKTSIIVTELNIILKITP